MMQYAENEEFWIVWNPKGGNPTRTHASHESATAEAERLAEKNPGQHFYVAHAYAVSAVEKPCVTRKLGSRVPF